MAGRRRAPRAGEAGDEAPPSCVAALAALLALPAAAGAHPLGNFSVNHQARVAVSADRVDVTYLLDQAEIPTFQERGRAPAGVLARKRAEIVRGLALTVGGRRVALRAGAGRIRFPAGQGGLRTTRVELALSARARHDRAHRPAARRDVRGPRRLEGDRGRPRPRDGGALERPGRRPDGAPDPLPAGLLSSPPEQREASLAVRAGAGTVTAPRSEGAGLATTRARGEDGFAGVLGGGAGLSLLLLAAAFGWGAVHALSPGHGKAMVAAYLVGTRGTPRHAVALGLAVTVTHTVGVFALGVVTLGLSGMDRARGPLPVAEPRRPGCSWRSSARACCAAACARGARTTTITITTIPDRITWRGLAAMGASAGLVPCPSALVVLLAAIAQHQVALGLVLIVAFSAGLAATLTALGLAVVPSGRALGRLARRRAGASPRCRRRRRS